MAPPTLGTLSRDIERIISIHERHEGEDDRRFEQGAKDREDALRRVYERLEKRIGELDAKIDLRMGEMGTKVDTVVTKVVTEVQALSHARAFADGRAAGMDELRKPSATRLAVISGVSGQVAVIIAAVLGFLILAGAGVWIRDQATSHLVSSTVTTTDRTAK